MQEYNSLSIQKKFSLPIKSKLYFPVFFQEHLNEYLEFLDTYKNDFKIDDVLFRKVDEMCLNLSKCIFSYYEGQVKISYDYFTKSLINFDQNLLSIFNFNTDEKIEENLFRARKITEEIDSKFEIFHLPMELRTICGSSRFGIAGFPCLYLSTSIFLCLKELSARRDNNSIRDTEYTNMFISTFELRKRKETYKIIDLSLEWNQLLELGIHNANYFLLYPVMFACSIRRSKDASAFVPEYIIPQMLLQYLISKMESSTSVFGIKYRPCYSDPLLKDIGKEYNYVFPIDVSTAQQEEGYSQKLINSFKWIYPEKLILYQSLEIAERSLIDKLKGID